MWTFKPLHSGKMAWKTRPFGSYSSIDSVLEDLSRYKGLIHGVIMINIKDANEVKLSSIQWVTDNQLNATFESYTELIEQIKKIDINTVHAISIYDTGCFIEKPLD
jgi:hypothetical protein